MEDDDVKCEIVEEWGVYYEFLERLRKSGKTNMWWASPYLEKRFGVDSERGAAIFASWIQNYSTLKEKYGW